MNIDQLFKQKTSQRSGHLSKDSLNKYKKVTSSQKQQKKQYSKDSNQKSSLNQFKKYFLDATNVFFEDRQELKQFEKTRKKIKILLPAWFFLVIVYYTVSSIKPYNGKCPQNATCKVFIRCNPGFELNQEKKQCTVKQSIIEDIEALCRFQIEQLRYSYGNVDCRAFAENQTVSQGNKIKESSIKNNQSVPAKNIESIIRAATSKMQGQKLKVQVQKKVKQFLLNQTNQIQYHFSCTNSLIIPTQKKHTFGCWLQMISQQPQFKFFIFFIALIIILCIWLTILKLKQNRIKKIYLYLKQKVLQQEKINVTLLGDEMKTLFGKLDEQTWIAIDRQRKIDGKICYYQDQFLYWKLI